MADLSNAASQAAALADIASQSSQVHTKMFKADPGEDPTETIHYPGQRRTGFTDAVYEEWEKREIKAGNLPKKKKAPSGYAMGKKAVAQLEREKEREDGGATLSQLNAALEEKKEEDEDLQRIRRKRLQQMKRKANLAKMFGEVYDLRKVDFTRDVNEASQRDFPDFESGNAKEQNSISSFGPDHDDNGNAGISCNPVVDDRMTATIASRGGRRLRNFKHRDKLDRAAEKNSSGFQPKNPPDNTKVWVVVLLYQEYLPQCQLLILLFKHIAKKFPYIKFVKGIASEITPGLPDQVLPNIFFYNNGCCQRQLFVNAFFPLWRPTLLEFYLWESGAVFADEIANLDSESELHADYLAGSKTLTECLYEGIIQAERKRNGGASSNANSSSGDTDMDGNTPIPTAASFTRNLNDMVKRGELQLPKGISYKLDGKKKHEIQIIDPRLLELPDSSSSTAESSSSGGAKLGAGKKAGDCSGSVNSAKKKHHMSMSKDGIEEEDEHNSSDESEGEDGGNDKFRKTKTGGTSRLRTDRSYMSMKLG